MNGCADAFRSERGYVSLGPMTRAEQETTNRRPLTSRSSAWARFEPGARSRGRFAQWHFRSERRVCPDRRGGAATGAECLGVAGGGSLYPTATPLQFAGWHGGHRGQAAIADRRAVQRNTRSIRGLPVHRGAGVCHPIPRPGLVRRAGGGRHRIYKSVGRVAGPAAGLPRADGQAPSHGCADCRLRDRRRRVVVQRHPMGARRRGLDHRRGVVHHVRSPARSPSRDSSGRSSEACVRPVLRSSVW